MGFLEPIIRTIKKKIIQNLRRQPERKEYPAQLMHKYLQEAIDSYNNTVNSAHKITPKEAHNIEMDPWLRKVQFPNEKLQPFDQFYIEEMARQKKANTPDKKARKNFDEKKFRVGDKVYLDWDTNAVGMFLTPES